MDEDHLHITIKKAFVTIDYCEMTFATEHQISAPISMTIRKGDRIAVNYDSKSIASTIFYALNPQLISCNNIFVNGN